MSLQIEKLQKSSAQLAGMLILHFLVTRSVTSGLVKLNQSLVMLLKTVNGTKMQI